MTSIIDRVAPHSVLHVGIEYADTDGTHTGIQLLNEERRSIFDVTLLNGKYDPSRPPRMIAALEPHRDYFIEIAERYASTRH